MAIVVAAAALVALFQLAGDAGARTGDIKKDPVDVVKKYVSLDLRGARLDALSWEALKPYITWKEEPAWGHVMVVSRYTVVDDVAQWKILGVTEVLIPVEFHLLGAMYYESASFLAEPQVERVNFHVKSVGNQWKILEPILPPHVGQKRLVNYVRQAILEETNHVQAGRLMELWDELSKAR